MRSVGCVRFGSVLYRMLGSSAWRLMGLFFSAVRRYFMIVWVCILFCFSKLCRVVVVFSLFVVGFLFLSGVCSLHWLWCVVCCFVCVLVVLRLVLPNLDLRVSCIFCYLNFGSALCCGCNVIWFWLFLDGRGCVLFCL